MTMKLPVILSAMIAALAIPGSFASEADASKGTDTAADTSADTAAAPEAGAGAAAENAAPAEPKKGKKHMKRKRHAEATDDGAPKKSRKHKRRRGHYADGSGGHVADVWDLPYDYAIREQGGDSSGCSGDSVDAGKRLPNEEPGYPGPNVPRGM